MTTVTPLETNYQFSVLPDTLYKTNAETTGLSQSRKVSLLVDDTDTLGTIFGSFVFPENAPNNMYVIDTNVSGIHIFDFLPNYLWFDSLTGGGTTVKISSINAADINQMPLNQSVLFKQFFATMLLNGLIDNSFPMARTSNGSGQKWSLRIIFKWGNTLPLTDIQYNQPLTSGIGIELFLSEGDTFFVYGDSASRITFNDKDFIKDRWYQMVVTFNGGITTTPEDSLSNFNFYLTDLVTGITNSPGIISNSISFTSSLSGITRYGFGTNNSSNIAIMDIWDTEVLSQTDAIELAKIGEVDPFTYVTTGGSTLFKGWAMTNIAADVSPFVFDYVYYRTNNFTTDPSNVFRLEAQVPSDFIFNEPGPAIKS